uniref:Uncharacterized protein n=1 Tax=Alexandrium andersonii TaxID=327968 RepID=A0A7S2H0L6_9DINO
MGVVAGVAQCCAGPRDNEKRASFPDEPASARSVKQDSAANLPPGAPIFSGQVEPVSAVAGPPSPPAAPAVAAPPKEAPAPTPEPPAAAAPEPPAAAPAPPVVEAKPKEDPPAPVAREEPVAPVAKEEPKQEPAEDGPIDEDECAPTMSMVAKASSTAASEMTMSTSVKVTKSSEPEEELPPAEQNGKVWKVVGGDDTGGIVVREGQSLKSKQLARLGTGAMVVELKKAGERLHFKKLSGIGPAEGWVSLKSKGKDLLVPA